MPRAIWSNHGGLSGGAAVEEAAHPAERETHEQPRRDAVGEPQDREPPPAGEPPGGEAGRGQRAEHDEAACGDVEHRAQSLRPAAAGREELLAVFNHIEEPGADEAPQKHLHAEREDRVGVEAGAATTHDRQPGAGGYSREEHDSIAADRHARAVIERRQPPHDHSAGDREGQSERGRGRPPTMPHRMPHEEADSDDAPRREQQADAEERYGPVAERHGHGDVEERRSHQPAPLRGRSGMVSMSLVTPTRPATSTTAGRASIGGSSDSASTTAA